MKQSVMALLCLVIIMFSGTSAKAEKGDTIYKEIQIQAVRVMTSIQFANGVELSSPTRLTIGSDLEGEFKNREVLARRLQGYCGFLANEVYGREAFVTNIEFVGTAVKRVAGPGTGGLIDYEQSTSGSIACTP